MTNKSNTPRIITLNDQNCVNNDGMFTSCPAGIKR